MDIEASKTRLQEAAVEILDRIPTLIIIADESGNIVYVNRTVETLFGYRPEEVLGNRWWGLTRKDPREQEQAREFIRSCAIGETEPDGEPYEEALLTRSGEERVMMWRDVVGPHRTLIGVGQDVTERRRIDAELRDAQGAAEAAARAKDLFLAHMSHEIRTPLNAVVGVTELLMTELMTPSQRELVEVVRNSGNVLLALVNDVLDYSRIESGGLTMEQAVFDLRPCLEEALSMVRSQAVAKDLTLELEVEGEVPERFVGDVTRIRQILTNLLANAVKFTLRGSVRLRVGVGAILRTRRTELVFSVRDTGIGIPEDQQELIFDSFSQGDASVSRRYGGTGLGLTISRNLCERMGGTLWVESREGEGSTFSFSILVGEADEAEASGADGHVESSEARDGIAAEDLGAMKILLAEDNTVNQMVALMMLERLGCQADVALSGVEVLAALERSDYDVVLLDIQMPEMDGLEAARRIRGMEKAAPRLIAMTANAMDGDREKYLQAGMDDYVAKPMRMAELKRALSSCWALGPSAPSAVKSVMTSVAETSAVVPAAETCPFIDRCPMFPLFQNDSHRRSYQTTYCQSRFGDCQRYLLASTGKMPDPRLLPDGQFLPK